MIQLYAHIDDLTPTELYLKEEVEEIKESVRTEGIKEQLNVDPSGNIIKGHNRYYCARILGLKYLPVRSDIASGLITDKPTLPSHMYSNNATMLRPIKKIWAERKPVTKQRKNL